MDRGVVALLGMVAGEKGTYMVSIIHRSEHKPTTLRFVAETHTLDTAVICGKDGTTKPNQSQL